MPFPNEHAVRIRQPGTMNPDSFRRTSGGTIIVKDVGQIEVPKRIDVIWGKLKGASAPSDPPLAQSLRFRIEEWTAAEARKWLADNDLGDFTFERAEDGEDDSAGEDSDDDAGGSHEEEENHESGHEDHEPGREDAAMSTGAVEFRSTTNRGTVWIRQDRVEDNSRCFALHLGPWCIEPVWFREAIALVKAGHTPRFGAQEPAAFEHSDPVREMKRNSVDGVAVVNINGPMMKGSTKFSECATLDVRKMVRAAANDAEIHSILLAIDSPGGHFAGTKELADEIAAADRVKPVVAHIEDLGASAAFWAASQSRKIVANATAEIGSIGTIAVIEDSSKRFERAGIEVHVVSTGMHKGAFIEGAPVDEEHLEALRGRITALNEHFLEAVARGRGLDGERLAAVTDGSVHIASQALKLGLIDEIASLEATIASLAGGGGQISRGAIMGACVTSDDGTPTIGAGNLSDELNRLVDDMTTEDMPREQIVEDMANAAGIEPTTVNQILNGEIECPPLDRLEGFAEVLDTSLSNLREMAEQDGCSYEAEGEETEATSRIAAADTLLRLARAKK